MARTNHPHTHKHHPRDPLIRNLPPPLPPPNIARTFPSPINLAYGWHTCKQRRKSDCVSHSVARDCSRTIATTNQPSVRIATTRRHAKRPSARTYARRMPCEANATQFDTHLNYILCTVHGSVGPTMPQTAPNRTCSLCSRARATGTGTHHAFRIKSTHALRRAAHISTVELQRAGSTYARIYSTLIFMIARRANMRGDRTLAWRFRFISRQCCVRATCACPE